jgi:hypothetical protein
MIGILLLFLPFFGAIGQDSPAAEKKEACVYSFFIPPKEWLIADPKVFAPSVQAGFIGKNRKGFCPSINLAIEEVEMPIGEYLKVVKQLHEANRDNRWRDLGNVQTRAGQARITEIDTNTEWGQIRLLQSILIKNGSAYILTAAALKEEFGEFYEDFEKAIRSFTITTNLASIVPEGKKREKLELRLDKLKQDSKSCRETSEFQKKHWLPFQKFILNDFRDMGPHWQALMLRSAQEELF